MNRAATIAAASALAATTLVFVPSASASNCGPGETPVTVNGQSGCASDQYDQISGMPASWTKPWGGVAFRDKNGVKTASGMSVNDQFTFSFADSCAHFNGERMAWVTQTTQGKGGWGTRYSGYIPTRLLNVPADKWPC